MPQQSACKKDVEQAADELLQQLEKEKCLYTRIAICETLEAGDQRTAEKMALYLGRIGTNQYKTVPETVSAKKVLSTSAGYYSALYGKN